MLSLVSNGAPAAETSAVYALLAVIADPAAAKQRLDDLVAQAQKNDDALTAATAAQAQAKSDRAAATAALNKSNALLKSNQSTADDLAAKQTALNAHADALNARGAEMAAAQQASEAAMANRETEVKAREDQVSARETEAKSVADAAQMLKSEYEQKLTALKAVVQ